MDMPVANVDRRSLLRYEALSRSFSLLLGNYQEQNDLSDAELEYLAGAIEVLDQLSLALGDDVSPNARPTLGVMWHSADVADASLRYALQAFRSVGVSPVSLDALKATLRDYRGAVDELTHPTSAATRPAEGRLSGVRRFFQEYNRGLADAICA